MTLEILNSEIDFEFNFGERKGRFGNAEIFHNNIDLVSSPTVSSTTFEIQISKEWNLGFGSSYTLSGEYQIMLSNQDNNSDQLPDGNEQINYLIRGNSATPIPEYDILKVDGTDFRFCTYNVLRDNIFESGARSAYSGILKTINPDVIIFQEIYDHTSTQTLTRLLNVFNALDNSSSWYSSDRGSDNIILSKYPIIYSREVAGNGVFVINRDGVEIMIANVHLPCCERDFEREQQIDNILAFIRKSKAGDENFTLKTNSPIIIAGDTNFVGNADQVHAFINGDIFDNGNAGPDFEIDWDTDGLTDLKPFATGKNTLSTWHTDISSYSAGRLDYIFYSDHSMEALNSFVLNTASLKSEELSEWNLEKDFTRIASDHHPVIADFKLNSIVSNDPVSESKIEESYKIWPNPASEILHIDTRLFDQEATFQITDHQGRLVDKIKSSRYDLSALPVGNYYFLAIMSNQTISQKLVIAR